MTSALIMLALLSAQDGRQTRAPAVLSQGNRVDLLGDDMVELEGLSADELAEPEREQHIAMFGDWTIDQA
jgi:hypothetical protein